MLHPHEMPERLVRQQALEEHCLAAGAERFKRRLQQAQQSGQTATMGAARRLLVEAIEPLEQAIKALCEDTGKRGPKHLAVKWCKLVGYDVAAYMTAKVVLDGILERTQVRSVAKNITSLMRDELRYRRFREKAPGLFEYRMNKFTTSNYAHMARSLNATMSYAKVDTSDLEMPERVQLLVGTKLVDLLIGATGLCTVETVRRKVNRKPRVETFLVATQETRAWLDTRNAALEPLWPVNLPMIVPPLPWEPNVRGGYRFAMRGKHALVRGCSKGHQKTIAETPMPAVYDAVNRIQETAWRINPHVLALVEDIVQQGGGLASIPSMDDLPLPPKPLDIATNREARRAWRRQAATVRDQNHGRQMRAKEFFNTYATARNVATEEAIWFPCNMDFRGRVYPVVNYLTPQGDDLAKGLLTFAEGKPLGEQGARWLATHGANCLGETPEGLKLSKCTLQERVDWIVAHTVEIEAVATGPLQHRWWMQADDPFQFFAFCVEWAGYVRLARVGRGEDYVCSLPCAMDGTCNGLQHFAAMLRDAEGAQAVNVAPTARPSDIYSETCERVTAKLERLAGGTTEDAQWARMWLASGLLSRKLFKRPTMTFGYGSKKFGFRMQVIEYVRSHEAWEQMRRLFTLPADQEHDERLVLADASGLLAELIWEALEELVAGAFTGMAWLQATARLVAANGGCVFWHVPGTNFPVRQEYTLGKKRQVETVLAGKMFRPVIYDNTSPKPDRIKQANAVSPNFVHSLDAAALQLTVALAAGEGVECFGMIHDSYATLPADADVLAYCTRAAFHALYADHDVLAAFAAEVRPQMAEKARVKMPALPSRGTLDLAGVFASEYFFS